MDPISITAIAIFGVITLTSLFTWIFNMVNTYQQTQAQKSIAESTKEGLGIQRDGVSVQKEIAENTSNFSSHLQNQNQSPQKTPQNKKEQSQTHQR